TYVEGKVKILHGEHPDMDAMADAVNKEQGKRVLTGHSDRRIFAEPKPMKVVNYPGKGKYRILGSRVVRSLREDGLSETLRTVRDRFKRLF
ncbi:MAG: hypothetical protein SVW02_01740, partial [Candidatus Nanohaloarchaea archaeon]|nr:hypothetical protein [Candidatus Nanohaloarchaea archaeon]